MGRRAYAAAPFTFICTMKKTTFDFTHSKLAPKRIVSRAEQYAFLLKEAADGFPSARESAAWTDVGASAGDELLRRINKKAQEIRKEADLFILIGVGGSNNAARSVIEALGSKGVEICYAGTSTAPSAVKQVLERMEDKSVFVNIIAKNFETLEPGAAFRVIRRRMYEMYGADAGRRITATGTRHSRLHRLCAEHGWDFFEFPENVGGRYSALTEVGLLPMAVAGINIAKVAAGAAAMREQLLAAPAAENPALLYAAARTLLYGQGYRAEMLTFFEPQLRWFSKWWIQLFGESEGKQDKGLLPLACECSEELHSMGQFLQQGSPIVFETFLRMEETSAGPMLLPDGVEDGFDYLDPASFADLNRAAQSSTLEAHSLHLPCLQIGCGCCAEETFGALFYFFMLSCVFACRMLGVDPFDQPGVEAYKKSMFQALGKE